MKPFLIVSSTDKARYEYAKKVAEDNDWVFIPIEAKEAKNELYRASVTSTLNEKKIVYLIEDSHKLNNEDAGELLKYSSKSPHMFFFSARSFYDAPKALKEREVCQVQSLSTDQGELFRIFNLLRTEPDRDLVREKIKDSGVDIKQLLHILKNGVWDKPEIFKAVEPPLQKIYISNDEYLLSMLVYLLPIGRHPFKFKNKEAEEIKKDFEEFRELVNSKYPHMTRTNVRKIFKLFPGGWKRKEIQTTLETKEEKPIIKKPKVEEKKIVSDLSKW